MERLYFDNSATSFPKPPAVAAAVSDYFENVHASAGRGAYREAVASARIVADCRAAIAGLFACDANDHVVFTLNGTDALNIALRSILRGGDHVVTTVMDHNSVLRPLSALESQIGLSWTACDVDRETTLVDPAAIRAAIRPNTRLVAVCHASNVTGALQPLAALAQVCRECGARLLVDAAQSAGHVPIDMSAMGVDLLATPGHKGLLGPLGTGVLVIRGGLEREMRTVREGGTGSASELAVQPDVLPDRFEAGSHNAPGIAGLLAAVRWVGEQGVETLRRHEQLLCRRMIERLGSIRGLTWFGPRDVEQRVGVFCLRMDGFEPEEVSTILESRFGVLSRSGLHCAPFAHRALGTLECGGATRLSFGPYTTVAHVDCVADALAQIAAG